MGNIAGIVGIRKAQSVFVRKMKQGDQLENLGVDGKIFKRTLKNLVGRA
jgi:hypothetical protein